MNDHWALWPDGTMCPVEDVESEYSHMSDDYIVVLVLDYEEDEMTPKTWRYFK